MMAAFFLLGLSVCAVWLPSIRLASQIRLPLWAPFFLIAICAGLAQGFLRPLALASLGALSLSACLATRRQAPPVQRIAFGFLSAILALLMAMHRLPGFNNPVLWADLKLTPDAAPFTLYANFDKGAVGLILLAFFCKRISSAAELRAVVSKSLVPVTATLVCVLTAATAIHYTRPEFKFSQYTGAFLLVNLFFTVVAEETFFRGLLQDRLAKSLTSFRLGNATAIAVSGLLFGIVHFAGGAIYVALATLSGIGYAIVYSKTERVESTIAAHFLLNAIHFIGFTYPFIQPA